MYNVALSYYKEKYSGLSLPFKERQNIIYFFRSYQQQFEGMKRQVDEARSRAAIAEEECAKLKEAVSRYQRRNSPAGANLFRPIASPVVTRKRLSQTGNYLPRIIF